ncbi:MAG TPA: DUF2849 domain-containing protein [Rhizomicrobium sp.]|nr:DUF2849 domain-containing protein [Rhizomicrobium sp.]
MAKVQTPQMLTANRLVTGEVVYWARGIWIGSLTAAEVFADGRQAEAALDQAKLSVADRTVVNPYLFPVRAEDGHIRPLEEREIIRAAGPTVRSDLGRPTAHV